MILSRRSLIIGSAALIAAPAIVRASSLMKVKVGKTQQIPPAWYLDQSGNLWELGGSYTRLIGWIGQGQQFVSTP